MSALRPVVTVPGLFVTHSLGGVHRGYKLERVQRATHLGVYTFSSNAYGFFGYSLSRVMTRTR